MTMDTKLSLKEFDSQKLFFLLFFSALANTVLFALASSSESLLGLFYTDRQDSFMDLFNPIEFARGADPYENVEMGAIYPALCYVIYRGLSLCFPPEIAANGAKAMRATPQGTVMTVVFSQLFIIALILFCLYMLRAKSKFYILATTVSILFAAPVIFQWERANILGLSLVLLIAFVLGMHSENKIIREISYICLALSASLKIYPAIFGVLLLLEKRWKDTIRTAIYGIVAFFLPFWFFDGIESLRSFISNLTSGTDTTNYDKTGIGARIDLSTNISVLKWLFGKDGSMVSPKQTALLIVICIVMIAGCILLKERWKKLLCLTVILIAVPSFSFEYCACFYIIPFVFFMQESRKGIVDYLYAFAFFMMFAPVTFMNGYLTDVWVIPPYIGFTLSVVFINLGHVLIMLLAALSLIIEIISRFRNSTAKKASIPA